MPPTDPVIAACLEALQRNPHDTETLARLGALHHARGEMEQARTFYFRALGIDPAQQSAHDYISTVIAWKRSTAGSSQALSLAWAEGLTLSGSW